MSNVVWTWIEKELGLLKTEVVEITPDAIPLVKSFFADITPVMTKAAQDGAFAAVTVPGTGLMKAEAAFGIAMADLAAKGIPIAEADLKALIQMAYRALPDFITGTAAAQAVLTTVDSKVDAEAAALGTKA